MVLPVEIGDAAQDADAVRVQAWLDSGGDVNDRDHDGYTLTNCCTVGNLDNSHLDDEHVTLARYLIALGADVNIPEMIDGVEGIGASPLHHASRGYGGVASLDMIRLLLDAKANPNAKDQMGYGTATRKLVTPLFYAIDNMNPTSRDIRFSIARMLIRAGASLDSCKDDEPVEEVIKARESIVPTLSEDDCWLEVKALVAGVRQHGTYKRYMRAPHREVLAVRGLAQRGKLSTEHRALNFIAKLGERGVVWHILTYWRPTE